MSAIAARLGGCGRSTHPPIVRPAAMGTVELSRASLCILPDLCKNAKNAFSHRSLDGAENAPPTGCTGVLLSQGFQDKNKKPDHGSQPGRMTRHLL